jgi:hypothetical protein
MRGIVEGDLDLVEAERADEGENVVAFDPAMQIVHAAAEGLVLPGAPIGAPVEADVDAAGRRPLRRRRKRRGADRPRPSPSRRHIMRPQKESVGARGDQLEQLERIGHMVENAGTDDEIVALARLTQPFCEIAEIEAPCAGRAAP